MFLLGKNHKTDGFAEFTNKTRSIFRFFRRNIIVTFVKLLNFNDMIMFLN